MEPTNCEQCGRKLRGSLIQYDGKLTDGTPVTVIDATPDRDWIVCDSCNILLCHNCCRHPESGYCDSCIEKYDLQDYLRETGLVQDGGRCECL